MSGASANPLMIGGAKFQQTVLDWSKQSNSLFLSVFSVILVVFAIFGDKLPPVVRWQLSTTVGRLFLLILLYLIYVLGGWELALLFTIIIALIWSMRPLLLPSMKEGFRDLKKTRASRPKWFVETVLEENPLEIVEDRVETLAVQDSGDGMKGKTSR
jgi:ABC-type multidrug transport system fused ATPase/permease subunit